MDAEAPVLDAVIVGAGPAGLAAAACLRRKNQSVEIIEREDRVAPAWHRHYERLHLHTPKQHSTLPYAPYPAAFPTYPSRAQMIEYFDRYAAANDLAPRFGETVRRAGHDGTCWTTATDRDTYRSRALVIATGLNATPHVPEWPGREDFRGTVLHSAEYRNGEPFRDRDVLVVGFGNSGGEIAIDLVEHGARVGLAVRGPVNIMPRDVLGIPLVSITLKLRRLPARLLDAIAAPIQRLRIGDLSRYGLVRRTYGPGTQITRDARIPLIDIGTIGHIKRGAIRVHPGIARFTADGVAFTDGTAAACDAVVLATGYRAALGFLENPGIPDSPMDLPIRGAPGPAPGLYFSGFRVTSTGTLREIAIEAKRIAARVAEAGDGGRVSRPS